MWDLTCQGTKNQTMARTWGFRFNLDLGALPIPRLVGEAFLLLSLNKVFGFALQANTGSLTSQVPHGTALLFNHCASDSSSPKTQ